jgi:hypothetical protein
MFLGFVLNAANSMLPIGRPAGGKAEVAYAQATGRGSTSPFRQSLCRRTDPTGPPAYGGYGGIAEKYRADFQHVPFQWLMTNLAENSFRAGDRADEAGGQCFQ